MQIEAQYKVKQKPVCAIRKQSYYWPRQMK